MLKRITGRLKLDEDTSCAGGDIPIVDFFYIGTEGVKFWQAIGAFPRFYCAKDINGLPILGV